MQDRLLLKGIC